MTFSSDGDPSRLRIPSNPFDFFAEITVPEGRGLICDTCSAELTDSKRISLEDCYQTTYGLVCSECYNTVFRPDIEDQSSPDHGKVRLLRVWKKGEDLHALKGEPAPATAIISCPSCKSVAFIELGIVSLQKAQEMTQRCPSCGKALTVGREGGK